MSRYRKIDPRLWGDEKFRELSRPRPNAQTLWLYILTGPHTTALPGFWILGEVSIAEALGWSRKTVRRCFAELEDRGMVAADWPARLVLVPNVVRYDGPGNPNVVTHWARLFDEIPDSPLKARFESILAAHLEGLGKPFREAFQKGFRKGLGNPDPLPSPLPDPSPSPAPLPQPDPLPSPEPHSSEVAPEVVAVEARKGGKRGDIQRTQPRALAIDELCKAAAVAWEEIVNASKVAPAKRRIDERAKRALTAIGGWPAIESLQDASLGPTKNRFREAFITGAP